jgi:hypothetical protein
MNTLTTDQIAEKLYETYCESVGGKAFNGDPLPNWLQFSMDPAKEVQANGWRSVALKARELFTPEAEEPKPALSVGIGTDASSLPVKEAPTS